MVREAWTGSDLVTWGEVAELGDLREYRRKGVSLQRLRPVIQALRRELHTPCPLGLARPFLMGQELELELQEWYDRPQAITTVVRAGQTLGLTPEARRFLQSVELRASTADAAARQLRPAGPGATGVIDPLVCFGRPAVSGVPTEGLWELHDAGESVEEIADGYDLSTEAVRAAVASEEQQRSLAA